MTGSMTKRRAAPAARAAAFLRVPVMRVGFVLLFLAILDVLLDLLTPLEFEFPGWILFAVGFALLLIGTVFTFFSPTDRGESLTVDSPVVGRWQAVNSPASKVPSHSTHAYGQAYAIDLVHLPEDREHPEFGEAAAAVLPPERFPAFGQPILAAASGVVVDASDRLRDHGSRSNWTSLIWFMLVEGFVRELGGAGRVIGNHVIVRLDDGSHLVYAHLKQGSLKVTRFDRVEAGQQLAECGNTGNSTEPHLHIHRQDVADPTFATGLPWAIRGAAEGGTDGFPKNEQTYVG